MSADVMYAYVRDPDGNIFECLEVSTRHFTLSVERLKGRDFITRLDAAVAAHYGAGA
jgi:hypothetical protein